MLPAEFFSFQRSSLVFQRSSLIFPAEFFSVAGVVGLKCGQSAFFSVASGVL